MGGGQTGGVSDGFTSYEARRAILHELHDHRVDVTVVDGFEAYSTSYRYHPDAERFLSGLRSFFVRLGGALKKAASIFGTTPSGPSSTSSPEQGKGPKAEVTMTRSERSAGASGVPNSWSVSPIGRMMMLPAPVQGGLGVFIYPRPMPIGAMNMSSFMISGRL